VLITDTFSLINKQLRGVTSSDATQIAVSRLVPADSPVTILLVHGVLHDSQMWFKQLSSPSLAPCHIVTTDLRWHGHGYSAKPTDPAAYSVPVNIIKDHCMQSPCGRARSLNKPVGGQGLRSDFWGIKM
jgi:hypothetical protein